MNGWTELHCDIGIPGARAFQRGSIRVLVDNDSGWHISVSHPHRYPKWDEIRQARYDFVPNEAYMVMVLPPKEDYVNIHENCFHLWEISKAAYEGNGVGTSSEVGEKSD